MKNLSSSQRPRLRGVALIATAVGAVAVGSFAIGAVAVGAFAIGALTIRRLTIRRVMIEKAAFASLKVHHRTVTRLSAAEITVSNSLNLPGIKVDHQSSTNPEL